MYPKPLLARIYRTLYTIRLFETSCIQLYRRGLIRGYLHPYLGEEAVAVGVCTALREDDYIVSTHRGHGHCIARGARLPEMVAEIMGREAGYCRGRGGSMHIADTATGNLGANGVVGAGIPLGLGAALGARIRQEDRVAVVFFSDGATNNGVFAESLNLAAIWNLPVLLVLENNQYAVSTPIEQTSRDADLHHRGTGYCVESFAVDGNDVLAVYERTLQACQRCRCGEGPVLMEAKTYRQGGHHVNDPGQYMPAERVEHYRQRDPLVLGRKYLLEQGGATEEQVARIEAEVDAEMAAAIAFAQASPEPSVAAFLAEVSAN
ncbi:MAG: thiamine pyrophosphate-dependent dehydrogenase E1 component subunit alpha [Candidatus Latescibacterota bacterium]